MRKSFYSLLLLAGICAFSACSNGDYSANPSSNVNGAVNPLNPLKASEFTWAGEEPLSADEAHWGLDTSGANIIIATKGNKMMYFRLTDVWTGNLYDMQYHNYKRFSYYTDSSSYGLGYYQSNLDNSGEINIIENDTAVIIGKFYYKGANILGQEVSIKNGYFKISKY
jgi:hypothetical protein